MRPSQVRAIYSTLREPISIDMTKIFRLFVIIALLHSYLNPTYLLCGRVRQLNRYDVHLPNLMHCLLLHKLEFLLLLFCSISKYLLSFVEVTKDMTHLTQNSMTVEFLKESKEINMYSVYFASSYFCFTYTHEIPISTNMDF